jgi:hypothetical protein
MVDSNAIQGQCLCGDVKVTAVPATGEIHVCHCNMCRKWAGGPALAFDCGTDVSFSDDAAVSVYDSSDWAQRGFCSRCGSHVFYRIRDSGQYFMPVGLFDDDERFEMRQQIFIDEKPHYYRFAGETTNLTGAEVYAMYAPQEESGDVDTSQ